MIRPVLPSSSFSWRRSCSTRFSCGRRNPACWISSPGRWCASSRSPSSALAAGARQLHLFRALFRRAAWLDLRAGAHGKRQVRAGDHEVMSSQAGRTDRKLSDAAWLTTGALPRLLGVLDCDGEEARVVGGAVRNALLGRADRGNRRCHDRRAGRSRQARARPPASSRFRPASSTARSPSSSTSIRSR